MLMAQDFVTLVKDLIINIENLDKLKDIDKYKQSIVLIRSFYDSNIKYFESLK